MLNVKGDVGEVEINDLRVSCRVSVHPDCIYGLQSLQCTLACNWYTFHLSYSSKAHLMPCPCDGYLWNTVLKHATELVKNVGASFPGIC